jgi:uncharacterized RmlC-like cupin family protein
LGKLLFGIVLSVLCAATAGAQSNVKVDNDFVRIISATDAPHVKGSLHRHQFNRVMVYLDAGDIDINWEGGHTDHQHWKAGQVAWSPAGGMHTSETVGSAPIRIVEIELKQAAPAEPPVRKRELDPLVIDPKHNELLFENDQVRVFRTWREPGASEMMHEHTGRGRVAVFLTDAEGSAKLGDGGVAPLHESADDVLWAPGSVMHAITNTGPKKFEAIVVEVK